MNEQKLYCDCHLKHAKELADHEKKFESLEHVHENIFNEIAKKTPNSYFVLLVMLVLGQLTFTWAVYEKVQDVETAVAVIKYQVMPPAPTPNHAKIFRSKIHNTWRNTTHEKRTQPVIQSLRIIPEEQNAGWQRVIDDGPGLSLKILRD